MIDLETVTTFMLENFQQVNISNNGCHFTARCIICGDSKKSQYKKRFHLDWNNGVPGWHCFNCDEHGDFYNIYGLIKGLNYEDVKRELHKWDNNKVKKYIQNKTKNQKTTEKEIKKDNFNWIKDNCYQTSNNSTNENLGILEKNYLKILDNFYKDRKIPFKYKIYICYEGRYKNRIIIPIFDENHNIIYFQARRIPGSGINPKYDNPQSPKELCILNRSNFDKEKYIIINEGLIDSFMIGNQGTSCLGKEISKNLLQELFNLTNKGVIIAIDNDEEAYKSLHRFMKENPLSRKVNYFIYPKKFESYKDINKIIVDSIEDMNIYDIILNNSVNYSTAMVKLKLKGLIL